MFDIKNSAEFYAMLLEDFEDFIREPMSSRRAIHCAIAANHLKDWVWHDWLKTDDALKRTLGISDKKSFYNFLGNVCVWLNVIRAVAEGAKHFENPTVETHLVQNRVDGSHKFGTFGRGFLLIDLGEEAGLEHRYKPTAQILEVAVRFWRDFFRKYRPEFNVLSSEYLLDGTGRIQP